MFCFDIKSLFLYLRPTVTFMLCLKDCKKSLTAFAKIVLDEGVLDAVLFIFPRHLLLKSTK